MVEDERFPNTAPVSHAQWGDGKVIKSDEDTVTVRFDTVGYKPLAVDLVEQDGLLELKGKGTANS